MNKRRQALLKQNKKTSLKKARFGIGDDPMSTADAVKSTIQRMRNNPATLTNPWVRENALNRPLSNNLSNVSNIDPAVLINSPAPAAVNRPVKPKPTKNPTIGVNLSNDVNRGLNAGLSFNSNRGGKGFNVRTNTDFSSPGSLLDKSSVTVAGNQVPIEATLRGDGSFNVGLNGSLNNLFNSPSAQARKAKRAEKKTKKNKN